MSWTHIEQLILQASQALGPSQVDGYAKCERIIRRALEMEGQWTDATNEAICLTGYEHPRVAEVYDAIRSLAQRGLLNSKGDLVLPAGPRYAECKISQAGRLALSSMQ